MPIFETNKQKGNNEIKDTRDQKRVVIENEHKERPHVEEEWRAQISSIGRAQYFPIELSIVEVKRFFQKNLAAQHVNRTTRRMSLGAERNSRGREVGGARWRWWTPLIPAALDRGCVSESASEPQAVELASTASRSATVIGVKTLPNTPEGIEVVAAEYQSPFIHHLLY